MELFKDCKNRFFHRHATAVSSLRLTLALDDNLMGMVKVSSHVCEMAMYHGCNGVLVSVSFFNNVFLESDTALIKGVYHCATCEAVEVEK